MGLQGTSWSQPRETGQPPSLVFGLPGEAAALVSGWERRSHVPLAGPRQATFTVKSLPSECIVPAAQIRSHSSVCSAVKEQKADIRRGTESWSRSQ